MDRPVEERDAARMWEPVECDADAECGIARRGATGGDAVRSMRGEARRRDAQTWAWIRVTSRRWCRRSSGTNEWECCRALSYVIIAIRAVSVFVVWWWVVQVANTRQKHFSSRQLAVARASGLDSRLEGREARIVWPSRSGQCGRISWASWRPPIHRCRPSTPGRWWTLFRVRSGLETKAPQAVPAATWRMPQRQAPS
jgi:hypothetical protein